MTARTDDMREHLLTRLRSWRRQAIHIGLSPRTSPAWNGLFPREMRGTMTAYAAVFDTALIHVGVHGGPDAASVTQLRRQTGEEFRWTVVVEDEQMMYRFPHGYHEWRKRGALNPRFLDPEAITASIAPLLRQLGPSADIVLLNIAPVYRTEAIRFEGFLDALTRCLDALPATHRYAVQTGNPDFVLPGYLDLLRERNAAHAFSGALSRDPAAALTADASVVRSAALAAEEEGEEWNDFRTVVRRCMDEGRRLSAYLGDGADGIAPSVAQGQGGGRLARLLAGLDAELARRSPIRRQAA